MIAMTKKITTFSITVPMPAVLPEAPLMLITTVRTMMPMISSIIAALVIVIPTVSFNFPSSLSVATVILTDVADMIVPMNRPFRKLGDPTVSNP